MHSETDEQTPSARAHITPEPRVDGVQGKRCKGKRGRHARGRSTDRQNYAPRRKRQTARHSAQTDLWRRRRRTRNSYAHGCHATAAVRKVLGTQRLNVDAKNQTLFGIEPDNRNLVKVRSP